MFGRISSYSLSKIPHKNKLIGGYLTLCALFGWNIYKSESYAERNYSTEDRLAGLSFIPVINIIVGFPAMMGYYLGQKHDKLLYYMFPQYYQKKIDEYSKKKLDEYIEYCKNHPNGSSTGNPQITY
jgi:hypothetical protein